MARASNPAGTTAMWVRDRLDGLWEDEDFAGWYPRDGRPGISSAQLATVSVLQFLLDLSDRDAAEAVRKTRGGEPDLAAHCSCCSSPNCASDARKGDGMSQEPRIKQGIQFVQTDQINGEPRIIGEDEAASLLWAAQWLDEHREYIITAMRFEHLPSRDDESDLTATMVISLTHAGNAPGGKKLPGLLGPWPHGVPPFVLSCT